MMKIGHPFNWLINRLAIVSLCIPLVVSVGCASRISTPLPEDVQAQLGTIGVVSAIFVPETKVSRLNGKGIEALGTVGVGLGAGLLASPFCFLSMGLWGEACVMTLAGPILGVYEALPDRDRIPSELEWEAETVLNGVLDQRKIQEMLRDHVVEVAQHQSRHSILIVKEEGPNTPGETGDYRHLAHRGIDTVLEVAVTNVGFVESRSDKRFWDKHEQVDSDWEEREWDERNWDGGKDWDIYLVMIAQAQLIRVRDNELLGERTCGYETITFKWSKWVERNGCTDKSGNCVVKPRELVAGAIEGGPSYLAEQIISAFGLGSGESNRCRE